MPDSPPGTRWGPDACLHAPRRARHAALTAVVEPHRRGGREEGAAITPRHICRAVVVEKAGAPRLLGSEGERGVRHHMGSEEERGRGRGERRAVWCVRESRVGCVARRPGACTPSHLQCLHLIYRQSYG